MLIITGLYLVLWGKSEERKFAAQEKAAIQSSTAEHGNSRASSHIKTSLTERLLPPSTENVWPLKKNPKLSTILLCCKKWKKKKKETNGEKKIKHYPISESLCVYEFFLISFLFLIQSSMAVLWVAERVLERWWSLSQLCMMAYGGPEILHMLFYMLVLWFVLMIKR